ncbi:MAG: hypothetical protein ACPGSM_14245 [Thiolinea sp.]
MKQRPDINETSLIGLLTFIAFGFLFTYLLGWNTRPGEAANQTAAVLGSLLLLVPGLFSILKRSNSEQNPPQWFVLHVLASVAGATLIFLHAAGGSWLSPPGFILLILIFLLVQGILARLLLARKLSHLFAASTPAFNVNQPLQTDRKALAALIAAKTTLLKQLDAQADEALFSPTLKHWLQSPWLTLRYQLLIEEEYKRVGARRNAGKLLAYWRRLHMLLAVVFFVGLLAHIVVVLFFAGYAAGGSEIYWWHIADWGGNT